MDSSATPFIRTVLGDIPATELGVCYAHEHIIIDRSFTTHTIPDFLIDSVDAAVEELRQFHADGGRTMIDAMPCDSGRNVRKLAQVSQASNVHIVCSTGLHLAQYYDPGHWGGFYTAGELAGIFRLEIEQGIDAHDCNGPLTELTTHRAGLIKIATERTFTPREEKIFEAAAEAHRFTGAPILTHTEQGELGIQQVEKLRGLGVDLRHVVLSHLDRKPDHVYHREILASGVRVEYDSAFRWPSGRGNPTKDLVLALLPDFPDQIMLGMDAARRTYWRSYGGSPGLSFLLRDFSMALRAEGLAESELQRIFVTTPADAYAFPTQTPA